MHLIVGLGNPGPKYALNRHNIGFLVVDALSQGPDGNGQFREEHKALVSRLGSDVLLVKPQTFMNLSGESVQPLMAFYKIPPENILVIHDEIDLPFREIRFQKGRGHGGHNGIRNIHEKIGPDYARLRFGVGRPTIPQMNVADYVLQNFSKDEFKELEDLIPEACDAVLSFIEDGFTKAQNKFNTKKLE